MTCQITLHKGRPTPENMQQIGNLIQKGFSSGINAPEGVIWEVGWEKSTTAA